MITRARYDVTLLLAVIALVTAIGGVWLALFSRAAPSIDPPATFNERFGEWK